MTGMTANRPISPIRVKGKASGPRKPKKRGNKLNGPMWQE